MGGRSRPPPPPPAPPPVLPGVAVLDGERVAGSVRALGGLDHAFAIVRMDLADPQLGIGHPLLDGEAQDLLDLRANVRRDGRPDRTPRIPGVDHAGELLDERLEPTLGLCSRGGLASPRLPLAPREHREPDGGEDEGDEDLVVAAAEPLSYPLL